MAATDEQMHSVHNAISPSASTQTFHVGTRRSLLARVQADEVVKSLRKAWPEHNFEIHAMSTTGDNNQKTALHKFNDKALWTQELEVLLQAKQLDFIVHCLKDMPTQLPMDLKIGCVTEREDPRDALVMKASLADKYKSLSDLPEGSVVGTSSLRRTAQMKRHHPHLRFDDVRGNVGTRLAKLDDPDSAYSAIVIAVAGLKRLGMESRVSRYLSKDDGGMLYAVGQGALAIEIRDGDSQVEEVLSKIKCVRTWRAGMAERMLMRTLEGGCSVPIGVETQWVAKKYPIATADDGVASGLHAGEAPSNTGSGLSESPADDGLTDELVLRAIVLSLDGQEIAEVETRQRVTSEAEANTLGMTAAKLLIEQGADKILHEVQLNRGIIKEQGNA